MFNKRQAQRWWAENCEKVMELYNVQHFNHQGVPLPAPPKSEDEVNLQPLLGTQIPSNTMFDGFHYSKRN